MANNMKWALDPRQPKRSAAAAETPVAKAVRKSHSQQKEED